MKYVENTFGIRNKRLEKSCIKTGCSTLFCVDHAQTVGTRNKERTHNKGLFCAYQLESYCEFRQYEINVIWCKVRSLFEFNKIQKAEGMKVIETCLTFNFELERAKVEIAISKNVDNLNYFFIRDVSAKPS